MRFKDRIQAGRLLADELNRYSGIQAVVFGLPRGGVVVGAEVARQLDLPIEAVVARKIGHPLSAEYAIGAVTEHGEPVWNLEELQRIDETWREEAVREARKEARRRNQIYSADKTPPGVKGRTIIVVDDGIATGLTIMAAVNELRRQRPNKIVVAVPVSSSEAAADLRRYADEIEILDIPDDFRSTSQAYEDFPEVTDEEVQRLLAEAPETELDPSALNNVIASIQDYPIKSKEVAARARQLQAPEPVVNFFESIPREVEFKDKRDLMTRAEATEILHEQEEEEPDEQLRSYE